ncbi:serine/threonine-protein kinase [Microbacterium sp. NPDC003461]
MAERLPAQPPVLPGLNYVRPLGSGGFADVYLYGQDMPRREVAVKVLPDSLHTSELVRMFNSEIDVLARLATHPSIVTIYDAGLAPDGRPYISMEYCPASYAKRYRHERIPVPEVLEVAVKTASALETAHRTGVIHRDIKPSNILVTAFGSPVLADFGISASLTAAARESMALSVPWSAPEVVLEQSNGTIASEVWGLGATIYSLLAGRSPFEHAERSENSREQLTRRIARAKYVPVGRDDLPVGLEAVLQRAMSREPGRRQPSALQFAEEIRVVQAGARLIPTPLEVRVDEYHPSAPLDLEDDGARWAPRPNVAYPSTRKYQPRAPQHRDEDDTFTAPSRRRRRTWPWLLVGGVALMALGAAAAVWFGTVI